MIDEDDFRAYALAADQLIERASKEQVADVARMLAINIGYYHQKYGEVPQQELLQVVRAQTLGEDGKRLLVYGMRSLVAAMAEVIGVGPDGADEARH